MPVKIISLDYYWRSTKIVNRILNCIELYRQFAIDSLRSFVVLKNCNQHDSDGFMDVDLITARFISSKFMATPIIL